jgi:regulator of protease activity HflC (stomatin/prohibitin superfamily)
MLKIAAIVIAGAIFFWPTIAALRVGTGAALAWRPPTLIRSLVALIAFVFIWTLGDSLGVVPAGETGVKTLFGGKVLADTVSEGLYVVPVGIVQVRIMDTKPHKLQLDDAEAVTSDRQKVHTTVALIVQIDPAAAPSVYRSYRSVDNVDTQVVLPKFQEAVKTITARYTAPDQIRLRPQIRDEMVRFMQSELRDTGIIVHSNSLAIINFSYDPAYQEAIEATQVAQQNLIKSENELKVSQIEAQKVVAKAQGDAQAARLIASANNATSIEKSLIEKWDGHMPEVVSGSGSGLIYSLATMAGKER